MQGGLEGLGHAGAAPGELPACLRAEPAIGDDEQKRLLYRGEHLVVGSRAAADEEGFDEIALASVGRRRELSGQGLAPRAPGG